MCVQRGFTLTEMTCTEKTHSSGLCRSLPPLLQRMMLNFGNDEFFFHHCHRNVSGLVALYHSPNTTLLTLQAGGGPLQREISQMTVR